MGKKKQRERGWVGAVYPIERYSLEDVGLNEMAAIIDKARHDENASHWRGIRLALEYDYGDATYIVLKGQRPETDAEFQQRLENEDAHEKRNADRDRQEFERLKKKFGG